MRGVGIYMSVIGIGPELQKKWEYISENFKENKKTRYFLKVIIFTDFFLEIFSEENLFLSKIQSPRNWKFHCTPPAPNLRHDVRVPVVEEFVHPKGGEEGEGILATHPGHL